MAEVWAEAMGLAAGTLTTLSFLPQVLKTWRSKSVGDLSLPMYLSLTAGVFLWLLYGLHLGSPSIVISNSVTFVLSLALLWMKLRYDRRR